MFVYICDTPLTFSLPVEQAPHLCNHGRAGPREGSGPSAACRGLQWHGHPVGRVESSTARKEKQSTVFSPSSHRSKYLSPNQYMAHRSMALERVMEHNTQVQKANLAAAERKRSGSGSGSSQVGIGYCALANIVLTGYNFRPLPLNILCRRRPGSPQGSKCRAHWQA